MLEVGPLPALYQQLGRMAIEPKMPRAGCIVDVPPCADPWQEGVHQRELLDLTWIHLVADHPSALVAELVHRLVDPLRRLFHVNAARRDRRVADAREIDGDDGEPGREPDRQRLPHLRGLGVAVQEQHGGALAADGGAQRAALDRHHLLFKAGPVIGGRHWQCDESDHDQDTIHAELLSVRRIPCST